MSELSAPMAPSAPVEMPAVVPTERPTFAGLDRTDWAIVGGLLLAFALIRGLVFPWAQNLYGDAIVRSEIAERWANDPKVIRSFADGVYQFGPLHFYLMGGLLKLWPDRENATRLLSLIMGVLAIVPLYRIGRRLFSREAAIVTALCVAVWGLHIQASTTAASEALFLTLLLFALDALFQGIDEERFGPLALAALLTNLACATRYDGWMYVPLLGLVVALGGKDRLAGFTRAVLFLVLCAPFPLWWMQQNEHAMGDALYPIRYIDRFHREWAQSTIAAWGQLPFRGLSLVFWPGALLVTTSLLVGLFALAGMWRAFALRQNRALAMLALVPAAYFTFRSTVLGNFAPIARFTMVQSLLALFFAKDGFDWVAAKWGPRARWALAGAAGLLAVATPLAIGMYTAFTPSTGRVESLRPITPLSTLPLSQTHAAEFLRKNVAAGESVVVDEEPSYIDLHIAYFTGLPETRLARIRWEDFEKQLIEIPSPVWLLAFKDGAMQAKEKFSVGAASVDWRGHAWDLVAQPGETFFIYRRR